MATGKMTKSVTLGLAALSIAALALTSTGIAPLVGMDSALAADGMEDTGAPAGKRVEGAKGLFFEQMEKPSESLNTGLRYWIEMKRNGTTQKVSNKTQFKAGDSIRFHVRSNINGYAYILLSSGSRGEQSVLFPDEKAGESNKVERTHEYILPQDGALTFDENPGTEKLTLLLSRMPIDAQSYLAKPAGNKEITLIASAQTGSKDLVPARIYVAFNAPRSDAPPPAVVAAANKPADKPVAKIEKTEKISKKKVTKTTIVSSGDNTAAAAATSSSSGASSSNSNSGKRIAMHRTSLPTSGSASSTSSNNARNEREEENTTTVVSENAKGILHVDVDLDHI